MRSPAPHSTNKRGYVPRFGATSFALVVSVVAILFAAAPVSAAELAARVRYISTDEKVIALTFDDGWSPTRALQIVGILDHYGATATFFPYANAVNGAEATWRKIAQRFPIGNHTTSHPNLTKLSATQVFNEIDGGRRIIEAAIGRPMVPIFRPPYMDYNDMVREQAFKAGYPTMALWSVDSGDSIPLPDARVLKRSIAGGKGGIVLMHAGPPVTVRVLPQVIESYVARGFKFVNLPEMLGIPWSPSTTVQPPPHRPDTGETPAQFYWTGPVYIRESPIFGLAPD
jgi:peptidoglycan/xylan/chitin deacetylase (PgdA/CDA1 family)